MLFVNVAPFILVFLEISAYDDISSLVDLEALSVLPLDTLLNIKKNVDVLSANNTADPATFKENSAEALPFHGLNAINNKEGYVLQYADEDKNYEKEKKKTISNFFQMSVTSLAFLAFGGYLVFLIITALKSKNQNYYYDQNTAEVMSAIIKAQMSNRRKKKKRPINNHFGSKEGESLIQTTKGKVKRHIINNQINIDQMYEALVNLCEGYSKIAGNKTVKN